MFPEIAQLILLWEAMPLLVIKKVVICQPFIIIILWKSNSHLVFVSQEQDEEGDDDDDEGDFDPKVSMNT